MANIVVLEDHDEELDDFWINGFERGMTMDLPDFDKHFSLVLKQYTRYLLARLNLGKVSS